VSLPNQDNPLPFCGPVIGEAILREFAESLMEHMSGDVTIALRDGSRYQFHAIFKAMTLELGDVVGAELTIATNGAILP
jgi:hypothetical protein